MHADAVQQLEVALLGSPAAEVVDLLSSGLSQPRTITVATAQPHPQTYTATPPAPSPASVPVVGVSKSGPIPARVTIEPKSDEEIPTTLMKAKISDISAPV